MGTWRVGLLGCVASTLGLAWACGEPSGKAPVTCEPGSEGCECYGNRTCDGALDCRSGLCVDAGSESGGSGGSGGTTTGGDGGEPSAAGGARGGGSNGGSGPAKGGTASGGKGEPEGGEPPGGAPGTGGTSDGEGGASGGTMENGGASGASTGGATATGGSGTGGGSSGPCSGQGFFLCDCLPRFGSDAQIVDGEGSEFEGIPAMTFAANSLPYLSPSYSAARTNSVTLRAAWTEAAFVAHVHVTDPTIVPDVGTTLWNGDNVQFFAAASSVLTGVYSGTEDGGAIHVLVAPPGGSTAARGIALYEPCYACVMTEVLPTSVYAARAVADGYEVEVSLPWGATGEPRVSGARVGFNFMIGVADTAGLGLELEAALRNDPTLASASCSPTPTTHPGCDDRVWCQPTLE